MRTRSTTLQYAHARTAAVARNAAEAGVKVEDGVDTPSSTRLLTVSCWLYSASSPLLCVMPRSSTSRTA